MSFTDYDLDETELAGTVQWLPPARTTAVTVPRCTTGRTWGNLGEPGEVVGENVWFMNVYLHFQEFWEAFNIIQLLNFCFFLRKWWEKQANLMGFCTCSYIFIIETSKFLGTPPPHFSTNPSIWDGPPYPKNPLVRFRRGVCGLVMSHLPGLVNVYKKLWKDPPFWMGKLTKSIAMFNSYVN